MELPSAGNTFTRNERVIIDSIGDGRLVSRKVSQTADVQSPQILRDLKEARLKYSPLKYRVADVPSRPADLPVNSQLEGQLTLELPTQKIPTDPAELASYNTKLATICQAALEIPGQRIKVDVLDEAGADLCPGNP